MDCLEGQFTSKIKASENIKDARYLCCDIRSMSHDWYSVSHRPSKQSMHALRPGLGNG